MAKLIAKGLAILLAVLVLGTLIFWALTATGIVTLNIKREVVQQSQQYIETKVSLLNKLYSDYTQLGAEIAEMEALGGNRDIIAAKEAQRKAVAIRIENEAGMIPASEVPTKVREFLNAEREWQE